MSRKLWTSAVLLAAITGTGALTPDCLPAQSAPVSPAPAPTAPATTVPTIVPAPDAAVVLADPNAPQSQRDEAARRLLSRHTDESSKALHDALVEPNVGGQLAVARALEDDDEPDPSFVNPLFALLPNRELALHAGRALSMYKGDPQVLTRLIDRATNRHTADWTRTAADWTRAAAIRAIGTMSEKRAASALMDLLLSPTEPDTIHSTAADALVNLTGLDQNGQDPARWQQWWSVESKRDDADFRQTINIRKDARLDQLTHRYQSLIGELDPLLYDQYKAIAPNDREALVIKLLNSQEADIRAIAVHIVHQSFLEGFSVSDAEKQRLRAMIGDSSSTVRRSVADAFSNINDAGALDALLAQLASESDSSVRAAIATALGPIHNLRAVPTLLKLLSDESLPTARAAAAALVELSQNGGLPNDPELNRKTAIQLLQTILKSSRTPGTDDLRAACVQALAPLKQADIVQQLLSNKLLDPGKEESWSVRKFMVEALGELNEEQFADAIGSALDDQSPNVRLQAIESLRTNPKAQDWSERIGGMLDPAREPDPSVRDAAWQFLQAVFPKLDTNQLQAWADRLKGQPDRQVLALEQLADKQLAAKQLDDWAVTKQLIGLANLNMKPSRYGDAAANFKLALQNSGKMQGAQRETLENDYLTSLLRGGKFAESVGFAAERIKADPREQNLSPIIVHYIEELIGNGQPADLAAARQLLDLARQMTPAMLPKFQDRLDDLDRTLKNKS